MIVEEIGNRKELRKKLQNFHRTAEILKFMIVAKFSLTLQTLFASAQIG